MRTAFIAVALWGSTVFAQTATPPPEQTVSPPALMAPGTCRIDRDCPGAEICESGRCVAGGTEAGAAAASASSVAGSNEQMKSFGFQIDAGVPDGLGLGILFRPIPFLRLQGSGLYNVAGFGARAGITIVPFQFFIVPTLTVEGGRYFTGDATQFAASVPPELSPMLRNISYDFANAHLAIELGVPQHFIFGIRFGLSYLQSTAAGSGQVLQDQVGDPTLEVADLTLRAVFPSAKISISAFF
jgi:hypothetical protein